MKNGVDILLYLMAFSVIVGGAYGLYDAAAAPLDSTRLTEGDSIADDDVGLHADVLPGGKILRVVIIGADDREGEIGRSDTLMVASLNPALKKMAVLSIPRDLRVDIPGRSKDKVNAAYAYGGPDLTVATVRQLLGQDTDFYMKIDFEGFVQAVDILGGVDITIPDIEGPKTNGTRQGMNYDDNWGNLHIKLQPGRQHLDGRQALGFVRYRHSNWYRNNRGQKYRVSISDLDRAAHQQMFLREMAHQKLGVLQVPRLLRAGSHVMKFIDTDMSWLQTAAMLKVIRSIASADIHTATVPMGDRMIGDIYYGELRVSAFHEELSRIDDHLFGRARTDCPVVVYNGCGKGGIAGQAADLLGQHGFENVTTDNAGSFEHATTSVEYSGPTAAIARRAVEALGCGKISASSVSDSHDQEPGIKITIGSDFCGPQ